MSTSLLKKSLKLFEDGTVKSKPGAHKSLDKLRKTNKNVITAVKNNDKKLKKNLNDNLKKLKLLSNYKVSQEVSDKIFRHPRDYIPLEKNSKKDENTAFTEEDFAAFERDYHPEN